MYGREAQFPLEVENSPAVSHPGELATVNAVVSRLTNVKEAMFPKAEKHIVDSQQKQKVLYRRRKNVQKSAFKVGELVLRKNMRKLTRKGSKQKTTG